MIYGLAASIDSDVWAVIRRNGLITVKSLTSTCCVDLDTNHDQADARCAMSADGVLLASGSYYGGVWLWEWRSRRRIWCCEDIKGLQSVQFASHDTIILLECENELLLINAHTRQIVAKTSAMYNARISPDGMCVTGLSRGNIELRNIHTGMVLWKVPLQVGIIDIVFASNSILYSLNDGQVLRLDLEGRVVFRDFVSNDVAAVMCFGPYLAGAGRISCWCALKDSKSNGGILIVMQETVPASLRVICERPWLWAKPIRNGAAWIYEDGLVVNI